MSTEVLETSLEMMHLDLVTFINDEPLDMLDEFTADEIASKVISIARNLIMYKTNIVQKQMISGDKFYGIKVNNNLKGFVSVSNDDCTGVSRTEYKPFWKDDEDGYFTGLCSLASMINEAWYLCNN